MNGLDLSNVVQIVLGCLGMGSNCRILLLHEGLAYNWIQHFHDNEAVGKSMLLLPKSVFQLISFLATIDKSRLST
jgi:hypothetical protein